MDWVEGVFWFNSLERNVGCCFWILYFESVIKCIDFIWFVRELESFGSNKVLVEFVSRN